MAKAMFGVKAPEWWKHLKYNKSVFWGRVRNQPLDDEKVLYKRLGKPKNCKFYRGPHQYETVKKTELTWYPELRWMVDQECKCKKKNVKFTN